MTTSNKMATNVYTTNPLTYIWNIVSTISGVIGLVSFTEDLIAWKKFIPEVILTYQKVVYSPFRFLELNWNEQVIDYFFIGTLCAVAFIKAIAFGESKSILNKNQYPKAVRTFYFSLYLIFWPLGILISLKQVFVNTDDESEKEIKTVFLKWLSAILLGFIIVLILNKLW